jgi:hypothetical protein
MNSITIQIPDYLRKQVEDLAAEEGFTVDQFFATAASEKLAVLEAVDYIKARASRADEAAFRDAISQIPATPIVEEWDQLPADYKPKANQAQQTDT